MSFKKPVASLIAVAIMAAFSGSIALAADSATTTTTTATSSGAASGKLVKTYSTFAGSDANSKALVDGLRNGTSITLTSSGATGTTGGTTGTTGGTTGTTSGSVTFTPKTSKLGFGNVNIALALAKAELTKMGITNPTPEQIQAALNGGTITTAKGTTTVTGILAMRSDGKGWGQIAKSMGFNLGQVVAASKTSKPGEAADRRTADAKDRADAKAAKADAKAEKVEKVAKAEKMEKPQKIDRPEKIDRPVKVERPERAERPQR